MSGDPGSGELLKLARQGVATTNSRFLWLLEKYAPKVFELLFELIHQMPVLLPAVQQMLGDDAIVAFETALTALSMTDRLREAEQIWSEVQKLHMLGALLQMKEFINSYR